jgi:thiol-disulfide isomerase/thioredoxin
MIARWLLVLALALCLDMPGRAADLPRPFDAATPAALARDFAGKPYILAFWSLECVHCQGELRLLARYLKTRPDLPLVLVAADTPELAPAIAVRLVEVGLDPAVHWAFADPMPERVRFAVDRKWRGELPRTYFFDAAHRIKSITGELREAQLSAWVAENLK